MIRYPTKLMVVAHPDDEAFFGGESLVSDAGWWVICLTNGGNHLRRSAFHRAVASVGALGEIWSYPDQPGWAHRPLDAAKAWAPFFQEIQDQLRARIDAFGFRQIVTHGADGEYGHAHHRLVHKLTCGICADETLSFFTLGTDELAADVLAKKLALIKFYRGVVTPEEEKWLDPWIRRATVKSLG